MPGQRRVAMTSGNVPDFDGAFAAAASDKFAVRRKSNREDPVIETSEHMKHTGTSKDNLKKNILFRVPGHRRLALTKRNQQKLKENLQVLVPSHRRLALTKRINKN